MQKQQKYNGQAITEFFLVALFMGVPLFLACLCFLQYAAVYVAGDMAMQNFVRDRLYQNCSLPPENKLFHQLRTLKMIDRFQWGLRWPLKLPKFDITESDDQCVFTLKIKFRSPFYGFFNESEIRTIEFKQTHTKPEAYTLPLNPFS